MTSETCMQPSEKEPSPLSPSTPSLKPRSPADQSRATFARSTCDPQRFAHLSEDEILREIAALLTTALIRTGRLRPRAVSQTREKDQRPTFDPVTMIRDPIERQLALYLRHAGPTSPADVADALNLHRGTVGRKLRQLRTRGICEVVGKTRGARYQLCSDYSRN